MNTNCISRTRLSRRLASGLFALALLWASRQAACDDKGEKDAPSKQPVETREVKAGDLTLHIPETWKKREPKSNTRLAEYEVPAVKGDKESGEFVVFYFSGQGGSVDDNVKRWIGQFE